MSLKILPSAWGAAALIALAGCNNGGQSPPAASADSGQLRAAARDPRVARFYAARQWRAAWTPEGEAALTAALGGAGRHGLDRNDYLRPLAGAQGAAAHDAALTLAALGYAEALARGRTDPARTEAFYEIPRPNPDLAAGLAQALDGGDVGRWLDGLAPQDADYRALSNAYVEANRQIAAAHGRPVPELLDRARTLAVNLERLRWLVREVPATRVDVNTAATTLTYWRDGSVADTRRVVAGSAGGRDTPSLYSPMFQLIANPSWTVPRSIAVSAGYMRRHHMTSHDGHIIQPPGPGNALGLVKFDMRNGHAIYLHDTPAKSLFARDERHASHGCVRVQDALAFAEIIAQDEGIADQWRRAQQRRDDQRYIQHWIPLPREIPVRLLYHTAYVENGQVKIVRDIYGRDERVAEALGLPARARPSGPAQPADVGP